MSTADRVQASVMSGLLRGELAPGTWLRQDELAERLEVSKIPVREALQRLAARGLVRFEPNRGAVVPELAAGDAEEIFALRRGIEPQLLARAIPELSVVDLAEAELALRGAGAAIAESNWAFHRALYRAAGWERGLAMTEIMHAAVAPYVVLYTEALSGRDHSDAEHRAMLDACRRGDRRTARRVLLDHLENAERALVAFLDERPN